MIALHTTFHDQRLAKCRDFTFMLFNQNMRHELCQMISITFKGESKMKTKAEELINSPD